MYIPGYVKKWKYIVVSPIINGQKVAMDQPFVT